MKSLLFTALLALGLSLGTAHAQFVTGDLALDGSNIENSGTTFLAIDFDYANSNPLINGVQFTSVSGIPQSGTNYAVNNTIIDGGTNHGVTSSDAVFPLVNYGALNLTGDRSLTLSLSGLTSGTTYSVQFIFDTGDTSGRSASVTDGSSTSDIVTAGAGTSPGAVYIIDSFTATDTTKDLIINDETDFGGRTPLNLSAFVVNVVPEPTTWAMLILGFVGLVFIQTRTRLTGRL